MWYVGGVRHEMKVRRERRKNVEGKREILRKEAATVMCF